MLVGKLRMVSFARSDRYGATLRSHSSAGTAELSTEMCRARQGVRAAFPPQGIAATGSPAILPMASGPARCLAPVAYAAASPSLSRLSRSAGWRPAAPGQAGGPGVLPGRHGRRSLPRWRRPLHRGGSPGPLCLIGACAGAGDYESVRGLSGTVRVRMGRLRRSSRCYRRLRHDRRWASQRARPWPGPAATAHEPVPAR